MITLDELEKRLETALADGPALGIITTRKGDVLTLLSAAREGERLREAAAFLLDRLTEHENRLGSVDDARQFHGHVAPAAGRLQATLSRIDAALAEGEGGNPCGGCGETDPAKRCIGCFHIFAPDHIGNSTTMVPALGVEGVARIIRQHVRGRTVMVRNGHVVPALGVDGVDDAARAIIAAMEKNDG